MKAKKSLIDSMALIGLGINATLNNPEIQKKMAPFGYTEEVMNTGKAKHTATQSFIEVHRREYGEQYTATAAYNALWNAAYDEYRPILTLSRVALKNKQGALHSLRATGTRNRSVTGFISDARLLYNNLLSQAEYLTEVTKLGVTKKRLTAAIGNIEALSRAYETFFKEKGEAQDATVKRDALFDDLYNWYSDFRAVARLALNDSPQLLEKLGIVVKR